MATSFLAKFIKTRLLLDDCLYKTNNTLPLLILLSVLDSELSNYELNIKALPNYQNYSGNAVWACLKRLETEKLIKVNKSNRDRRNKVIKATKVLMARYEKLRERVVENEI